MPRTGVVFVHASDELYGADRVVLEVIAAVPAGVAFEIWLPTDLAHPSAALCGELELRGVVVHHLDLPVLRRAYRRPLTLMRIAPRSIGLAIRLARVRPKVVYCTSSAALVAAPLARLVGVPRVIGHLQEVWSASDRRALSGLAFTCHRLIASSDAVIRALPGWLARRTEVVPNATPGPVRVTRLDGRRGPLTFVVASRWTPRKGHATLLAAWDRLTDPGCLVILGGPPRIGDAVDVFALVAALRDPTSVVIRGEVADIGPCLEQADVALMPSDDPESFGLVAIEAFAQGRPVIASATGGLREVIEPGVNGWLFEPRDVDGLARLLATVARPDVEQAGSRARQAYEARFTTARFTAGWRQAVGRLD